MGFLSGLQSQSPPPVVAGAVLGKLGHLFLPSYSPEAFPATWGFQHELVLAHTAPAAFSEGDTRAWSSKEMLLTHVEIQESLLWPCTLQGFMETTTNFQTLQNPRILLTGPLWATPSFAKENQEPLQSHLCVPTAGWDSWLTRDSLG